MVTNWMVKTADTTDGALVYIENICTHTRFKSYDIVVSKPTLLERLRHISFSDKISDAVNEAQYVCNVLNRLVD